MRSLQACVFFLIAQVYTSRGDKARHDVDKPIIAQLWENAIKPAGNASTPALLNRQVRQSICGYLEGNANQPRTANPGFDCRFDTAHALWGFCPTTVISATDCGLAGNCVDSHACTDGCGMTGVAGITTFTCGATQFCSTALLTEGPDQVFSYIACGQTAIVQHYLATPTATATTSTTAISSSSSRAATTTPRLSPTPTSTVPTLSSTAISLSISSAATTSLSTSTPTQQSGTTSSGQIPSSPTTSGIASTSNTSTDSTSRNHLGPIIGGAVAGLTITCLFVLGIIYLRRDARKHQAAGAPTPSGWWKGPYRTTDMQTAGLHEVEGSGQMIHEADAYGNGNGVLGSRFSGYAYRGHQQGKSPTYELGS